MIVKSINEQLNDKISDMDKMRIKIWRSQGLTENEIEQELLMRILSKPAPTQSKLLDLVQTLRSKNVKNV